MNKNKFFVNVSWIMIGRAVQLGLTFITTMLMSRYLGPTEYGRILYVYSYIQLFIPLCAAGMNDIVVKELVDKKDENETILGSMITVRLVFSLVSMMCSIALVKALNNEPIYHTIALLQSFSLMFQSFESIMYYYQAHMLSQKSGIAYALAYIASSLFRIACILLNKDIRWFAFALSLDYILLAVFLLSMYFSEHKRLRFSLKTAKYLLGKSYYYIFAGLLIVLYGKVTDIFLLGRMVDETTVGFYGAATTLCNAWPFILTAVIDSSNPIIVDQYSKDREQYRTSIRKMYAVVFYLGVSAAIMITFLSDFIIGLLYGNSYMSASIPMKIYSWNTIFAYLGVARTSWMQCEGKTRYETLISLFGAVVNVSLNYFLIKNYGIIGAAIAAVLTQFLTNFIFMFFIDDLKENAYLIRDAVLLRGIKK